MQQRQQVQGFEEDGEEKSGDGAVALTAVEARRGVAFAQDVELAGVGAEILAHGENEAVTNVEDGVGEIAGQTLVATADADHARVEAAAEVDFLQGFVNEVGFVGDDRFDEVAGEQVARLFAEDVQAADGLQAADVVNRAAEDELVAGADAFLRSNRRDEVVVAPDFDEVEAVQPLQAAFGDAFPGDVRLWQYCGGDEVGVFQVLAAVAVHGQGVHPPVEHGEAGDGDRDADRAELEHPQWRQSGAFDEGIDDEVGGGADEGGDAAEDGGVGERDEQARRRDFLLAGEGDEEGGDDGGVVHEGREQRADAGEAEKGALFVADEDFAGEAVQQRRALNHDGDEQQHHQRRQRRIGKTGEKRLGADEAAKHEGGGEGKKGNSGIDATAGQHGQQQRQGKQYEPVHGILLSFGGRQS